MTLIQRQLTEQAQQGAPVWSRRGTALPRPESAFAGSAGEGEISRTTRILGPEEQPPTAEHLLREAVRRALRKPAGRMVVVLHLSALAPPAPRPHHRRIARAVLDDAAQRHDGEVHALSNGDFVLICRRPADGDPALFSAALRHLFQVDAVQPAALVSLWQIERDGAAVVAYAERRLAEASGHVGGPQPTLVQLLSSLNLQGTGADATERTTLPDRRTLGPIEGVLRRQTAIRLDPAEDSLDGRLPKAKLRPLFRELSVSIPVLERQAPAVRRARADPFLMRYLATELDALLLEALLGELPGDAGLLDDPTTTPLPLHLNLTVAGVLSDGFARFVDSGRTAAIELQLIDICADPAGFAAARSRIAFAGFPLVLDGITHVTLRLASPAALQPDLLKLEWSPRLAQAVPRTRPDAASGAGQDGWPNGSPDGAMQEEWGRISEALGTLDPDRIVLERADSEEALRWGLARGLRNFQGSYVDVLQATMRLATCAAGRSCTLRQCATRAEATDQPTRAACGNHRMLDRGPPPDLSGRFAPGRLETDRAAV